MIKPLEHEHLTWQHLVEGKKLLEKMQADPKEPVTITDQYLRNNFVYVLIKECEDDFEYEETVRSVFRIVSSFGAKGRKIDHALKDVLAVRGAPAAVHNVILDVAKEETTTEEETPTTTMEEEEPTLDLKVGVVIKVCFGNHFCSIDNLELV